MSRGHGTSRRRSYGRRQKELRDRRDGELSIDLEGPGTWPRGGAWGMGPIRSTDQPDRSDAGGAA